MNFRPFLVFSAWVLCSQVAAQHFTKADILSDLHYLKTSLEATHFNLYAYTTKEDFNENYEAVKNQIKNDSISLLEVINLFQSVVSKANNAHTRIAFPVYAKPYIQHLESGGRIFPLEVAIENGKALVRKNWSSNNKIKIGAELRAINGIPINEVFQNIYPQISAERLYFKHAQLEGFTLPRYYWQVLGEPKEFEVELIQNGRLLTQKLEAIKAKEAYEMKRNDILKHHWEFKYLSNSAVYLRPGDFAGDENKYRQFIDSAFTDMNRKKVKNLVIDLRNHSGGDDAFSDYLVSYIADKPFKWSSKFQLKSSAILKDNVRRNQDTTKAYWKSILAHKNGEVYNYDFGFYEPQPKMKRYRGNVYVLVNRHSYSQSTVTAAQIQDYGFGKIVGEETAEYPNLLASIFSYTLPKTGIIVEVAKGKIYRVNGVENNKGLIPDILIKDHLLDENDEILEQLLKKIPTE